MPKRPSSFVMERPGTGWNWHAKCGADGPGGYASKNAADVALQSHERACTNGC